MVGVQFGLSRADLLWDPSTFLQNGHTKRKRTECEAGNSPPSSTRTLLQAEWCFTLTRFNAEVLRPRGRTYSSSHLRRVTRCTAYGFQPASSVCPRPKLRKCLHLGHVYVHLQFTALCISSDRRSVHITFGVKKIKTPKMHNNLLNSGAY
jgi:hypothetical protein